MAKVITAAMVMLMTVPMRHDISFERPWESASRMWSGEETWAGGGRGWQVQVQVQFYAQPLRSRSCRPKRSGSRERARARTHTQRASEYGQVACFEPQGPPRRGKRMTEKRAAKIQIKGQHSIHLRAFKKKKSRITTKASLSLSVSQTLPLSLSLSLYGVEWGIA